MCYPGRYQQAQRQLGFVAGLTVSARPAKLAPSNQGGGHDEQFIKARCLYKEGIMKMLGKRGQPFCGSKCCGKKTWKKKHIRMMKRRERGSRALRAF